MDEPILRLTPDAAITTDELRFTASTASGPGGQHVNKVSTRVTLLFDLDGSPSLSDIQKARLHAALSGRIGKDGVLRVVAQSTRSQLTNKKLAVERFVALLREALTPRPPRRKTRATLASKRRRLEAKRRRGTVKQQRSRLTEGED